MAGLAVIGRGSPKAGWVGVGTGKGNLWTLGFGEPPRWRYIDKLMAAIRKLKAVALAQVAGVMALGDDSGVEVEALGGAPGLYSARFAGRGATDADRRQKLLHELRQAPTPRRARFVCAIAVALPEGGVRLFEGECRGEIALAASGEGGFGYDPLFYVPEHGATMATLPASVKNTISHRARAMQAATPYLIERLGGSKLFGAG